MNKTLVFDMDGTIADFYGVNDWLSDLMEESTRPYDVAEPLYKMDTLNTIVNLLKALDWHIVITSWVAQNATKEYAEAIRKSKIAWLNKMCFPYDEVHIVKYGTTKANCTRKLGGVQILADDNEKVRKGWTLGGTIDANKDLIKALADLFLEDLLRMEIEGEE